MAIIIGVVIVSYLALISNKFIWSNFWLATSVLGPAIIMGLVGLWDDLKSLNPLPRFIGQSIAGIVVAFILILNDNIGNPTGITVLDAAITVIWIVGICNSINFFDNLDGGAAGTVAITAISLTYLAITGDQYFIAALSVVVAGSTLGFLIWNRAPARIYMGDAGALFLGTLLAVLTIRLDPQVGSKSLSFAIPVLLLALPILDTSVAVLSRIRRSKSIFQGGQDHLSHRLIRKGFTKRQAAYALWSLAGIFVAIAVSIATSNDSSLFLIILAALFWLGLLATFLSSEDQ